MDTEIWGTGNHHKRQGSAIHIFVVGEPLHSSFHIPHSDNRLPPPIQRPRGAFPPPSEEFSPRQGGRGRLVLTPSLGFARFQDVMWRGLRIVTIRSSVWISASVTRPVFVRSRAAVADVSQGLSRGSGWPHSSPDSPPHNTVANSPSRGFVALQVRFGPPRRRPAAPVAAL